MRGVLFLFFCTVYLSFFSQIGPGVWQDHTSLNFSNSVSKLGSKIYASNNVGLVAFNEEELAPQSITKINGLSDVGVKLLRTNPYNSKLLVIYENSNIDVIDLTGNIKNYPDFKLKIIDGKKLINEVTFNKQFAYLACGFGIVLFDTEKLEVKETFVIGPAGTPIDVYQVALNDSLIFAATASGIYKSNYKIKNLNNFNNWKLITTELPVGSYAGIVNVDGKLITAYSPNKLDNSQSLKDTLYVLKNNNWSKYKPSETGYTIRKFCLTNGELFSYMDQFGAKIENVNTESPSNYITTFNGATDLQPADIYFGKDYLSNLSYWVADLIYGLYQTYSFYPYYPQNKISRNGINNPQVNNIDVFDGKVAISPSHPDEGGGSTYSQQGLNVLKNGEWSYLKFNDFNNNVIKDITHVLFDRKDKTRIWATSWFNGLLEYKNEKLVAIYNPSNTPSMSEVNPGNPRCIGLSMDKDGNLWFANSDVPSFLNVRKKDGTFQSFNFGTGRFTRKTLIDKNNYIWSIHEREGGITVFKHNNFTPPYDSKLLTKDVGNGNLQSNSVFSIAEDRDGKIWVGTAAGIVVFYNPTSIFNSSNFDAQPIKIVQDGNVELLLGKEVVTSIVVDGADNKWIGTQTGGVYCFSPDGLKELYHFTVDNSPLYSNAVLDIDYDEVTGDLFFGTELGLQSYRGKIVKGEDKYSNVYAYPNPVKPNYNGTVLIRGLIDNSVVKIVDESGNLAWEGKSTGGQIEWGIANFSGNRVASGVYIVYATSTDGEKRAVSKILVTN